MTAPGVWRPQLRRQDGYNVTPHRPTAGNVGINRLTCLPISPSYLSTGQTTSPIANGFSATAEEGGSDVPSSAHNYSTVTTWAMEEDEPSVSNSTAAVELLDIKPAIAPKPVSPPVKTPTEQDFIISGVHVKFPFRPYPSQTALMEKVIRCLKSKTNGLLESPTGSGKSLSLLCSSLAWQKKEHAEKEAADAVFTATTTNVNQKRNDKSGMRRSAAPPTKKAGPCVCKPSPATPGSDASIMPPSGLISEDDDDMTFVDLMNPKAALKRQRTQLGSSSSSSSVLKDTSSVNRPPPSTPSTPSYKCACRSTTQRDQQQQSSECHAPTSSTEPYAQQETQEVPKIYFGSRTHKQITQLVRELRKVHSYTDTKMTILGSKDQYCVHPTVSGERNKNEACQELLDSNKSSGEYFVVEKGCEYHGGVVHSAPRLFQKGPKGRLPSVFDIEDLMESGKKNIYCPYFMSRELTEKAHLIFCPYNYLVDARIRQALKINLKGQIVIFDEGHNMEDAAREAASYTLSSRELKEVLDDISTVLAMNARHKVVSPVTSQMQSVGERLRVLLEWLENNGRNVQSNSFQSGSKELNGQDLVVILTQLGLGPDHYKQLESEYEDIQADRMENEQGAGQAAIQIVFDEEGQRPNRTKKLSAVTLNLLRSLVVILDYLFRLDKRHIPDYRGLLAKEMMRNNSYKVDQDSYRRKRKGHEVQEWSYKLHFWCLNPAVAFGDFHQTHSVILTSGTLSPMASFQSELQMPFNIQFEANHVINMRQVWAGAVGWGPAKMPLTGTYQHVQTLAYQDEVGQAVLRVCTIVPHGVLCFFTSYNIMDTLLQRWKETGVLDKMEERKVVVKEPRGGGGDKAVFQRVMDDFYMAISGESCVEQQDGAIMFAVFRGKISEGLDFADNNARAVITVSIPFPNFKDPQVTMKRQYNDQNQQRGLLSGSNWYDIQAFRALNQALGRCIRHKDDWGALVLLDSRFTFPQGTGAKNRFAQGLSKWLRPPQGLVSHGSFQGAMRSLEYFIKGRLTAQPQSTSPVVQPSILQSPSDQPVAVKDEDVQMDDGDDFFCNDL